MTSAGSRAPTVRATKTTSVPQRRTKKMSDDQTNNKPALTNKFSRLLNTPINARKIDLKSVEKWLIGYLKTKCPLHDRFIANLVIDHLRAHNTPDGKVIQVELTDSGLIHFDLAQRLMRKLWTKLTEEQVKYVERHHEKYQKISTPGGSTMRVSTGSMTSGNDNYNRSSKNNDCSRISCDRDKRIDYSSSDEYHSTASNSHYYTYYHQSSRVYEYRSWYS